MGSLNWPFQDRVRTYQAKMQHPRGHHGGLWDVFPLICLHSEGITTSIDENQIFYH